MPQQLISTEYLTTPNDLEPWTAADLMLCLTDEEWEGLSLG